MDNTVVKPPKNNLTITNDLPENRWGKHIPKWTWLLGLANIVLLIWAIVRGQLLNFAKKIGIGWLWSTHN